MKRILKFVSIAFLVLAGILFMYGGLKMSEAETQAPTTIDMGDGIVMARESQAADFSKKAFNISTVLGVGGVVLFLFARGMNK